MSSRYLPPTKLVRELLSDSSYGRDVLSYIDFLERSIKEVERNMLLADLKLANADCDRLLARAEAAESTITKLNIMYGELVRAAQEMMHVDLLNRREFHSVHLDLEKALCSLRSNGVIK